MSLEISNLKKTYDSRIVLNGINLKLENGIYLLTGSSGCGKTTLLRILSGLEKCDSGSYSYEGGVSFMFQEARLFPWMNVLENIEAVTRCTKKYSSDLFAEFGMKDELNKFPHELSGGMQRRVSIVRTLSRKAGLYLFDEPLAGLDAELKDTACSVIKHNLPADSTAIIVSHETSEVKKIVQGEFHLENGIIV